MQTHHRRDTGPPALPATDYDGDGDLASVTSSKPGASRSIIELALRAASEDDIARQVTTFTTGAMATLDTEGIDKVKAFCSEVQRLLNTFSPESPVPVEEGNQLELPSALLSLAPKDLTREAHLSLVKLYQLRSHRYPDMLNKAIEHLTRVQSEGSSGLIELMKQIHFQETGEGGASRAHATLAEEYVLNQDWWPRELTPHLPRDSNFDDLRNAFPFSAAWIEFQDRFLDICAGEPLAGAFITVLYANELQFLQYANFLADNDVADHISDPSSYLHAHCVCDEEHSRKLFHTVLSAIEALPIDRQVGVLKLIGEGLLEYSALTVASEMEMLEGMFDMDQLQLPQALRKLYPLSSQLNAPSTASPVL